MKPNVPVAAFGLVVVFTLVSATFRVYTAPDRIQVRQESARTTCTAQGGQWVRVGRDDLCQTPESK